MNQSLKHIKKDLLRFLLLICISIIVSACGNSTVDDQNPEGMFVAQEEIDVSDIEGFWFNACTESSEFKNYYVRQFAEFLSGDSSGKINQMSVEKHYFSDANCTQAPEPNTSLTDVIYIPSYAKEVSDFAAIGLYRTFDGIEAKVLEFTSDTMQSKRLAYFITNEMLYISYEDNYSYSFANSSPFRSIEGVECTAVLVPGISVRVFDQETDLPISCGASLTLGDGDFVETITEVNESDVNGCLNAGSLQGAFERPGFYNLLVSKAGYLDYIAEDIEVTDNICHVNTVELEVYLAK